MAYGGWWRLASANKEINRSKLTQSRQSISYVKSNTENSNDAVLKYYSLYKTQYLVYWYVASTLDDRSVTASVDMLPPNVGKYCNNTNNI